MPELPELTEQAVIRHHADWVGGLAYAVLGAFGLPLGFWLFKAGAWFWAVTALMLLGGLSGRMALAIERRQARPEPWYRPFGGFLAGVLGGTLLWAGVYRLQNGSLDLGLDGMILLWAAGVVGGLGCLGLGLSLLGSRLIRALCKPKNV